MRKLLTFLAVALCLPAVSAHAAVTGTLSITSSTHTANVSSTNSTVSLAWSGVTAGNGTITYEYVLDQTASINQTTFTTELNTTNTSTLKSANLGSSTSTTISNQVDGTYYFHLRGYDADGVALGTAVTTFGPIILDSAPTLSATTPISPATGSHTSAISVTISGTKFMNGATVDLVKGTTTVALTNVAFVSSTQLTATVPQGTTPGTYDVRVTNAAPFSKQVTKASAYQSTNTTPVANPGTDQALTLSGSSITLNLSGALSSDADGDTITSYTWTTVADPSGALQSTYTGSLQNLTVSTAGTYTFSLVVNDGYTNSSAVSINYVVSSPLNNPPTANAGLDQLVAPNTVVTLNGNQSSDPDGNALTYKWSVVSQPTNANITLSTSTTTASFTPTVLGVYTIQLIVNDGTVDSTPDQVIVTVNKKPTANAGTTQLVPSNQLVTLDGTGSSDTDGDTLTYAWTITSQPTGSSITLSSATAAQPTFTPTIVGAYKFSLTVNDGYQDSATASTVTINVNNPPTANAGTNKSVLLNQAATLDGTGSSDPDAGTTLTYAWSITSQPTGSNVTLSSTTASQPTFTPTVAGAYVFSLTVNDGAQNSASAASVTYTAVSGFSVTHSYVAGLNVVPFTVSGTGITTAAQLDAAIVAANTGVTVSQIFGWDSTNQRYGTPYVNLGGGFTSGDFTLQAGQAYFVQVSGTASLTLSGSQYASVALGSGLNLVAAPVSLQGTLTNASNWDADIVAKGTGGATVSQIFGWDSTNQRYGTPYVNLGGGFTSGDFALSIGSQGYFVQVSAASTYTP